MIVIRGERKTRGRRVCQGQCDVCGFDHIPFRRSLLPTFRQWLPRQGLTFVCLGKDLEGNGRGICDAHSSQDGHLLLSSTSHAKMKGTPFHACVSSSSCHEYRIPHLPNPRHMSSDSECVASVQCCFVHTGTAGTPCVPCRTAQCYTCSSNATLVLAKARHSRLKTAPSCVACAGDAGTLRNTCHPAQFHA